MKYLASIQRVSILGLFLLLAGHLQAATPGGTPFNLSKRDYNYLEYRVCKSAYNVNASKIKAFAFQASAATDTSGPLDARTSAYVECEAHDQFLSKPARYVDECDLIQGEWDCSPPQLEIVVDLYGREVKMRPWGLTPAKSYSILKEVSRKGLFQGESLDRAIGKSCDVAKTKDPDVVELSCEALMTISYWCPQAATTGCPRILFLSFDQPPLKRSPNGKPTLL